MTRKIFPSICRGLFIAAMVFGLQHVTLHSARAQGFSQFEGFYVGGVFGALFADPNFKMNGVKSDTGDDAAFAGGGMVGYNFGFSPQIILGLESSLIFTNLGDNPSLDSHEFSIVGRVGYLFTPNVLGFLIVGATGANFQARATQTTTTMEVQIVNGISELVQFDGYGMPSLAMTETREADVSQRLWGFTIGAGFDFFIFANIIAGIEYRFTNFESWNFDLLGQQFNIDEDLQEVRFRLAVPLSTIFGNGEPL